MNLEYTLSKHREKNGFLTVKKRVKVKTGYSILLCEYLNASDIDYRDCESFQVVCPVCYEPLFKVQRKKEESTIDYLSHYSADNSYSGDCELRIDSQSHSVYENKNKTARDQRLQYFIGVFQKMIAQDDIYPHGTDKSQKYFNKSKALQWFCGVLYNHAQKQMRDETQLLAIADEYLKDMRDVGVSLKTSFAMSVQKRITIDIWKYLLSSKGEINYRFLFNHAYLIFIMRLNTPRINENAEALAYMKQMLAYVSKIPETSKEKGMMIFSDMASTPLGPPFAIEVNNFLDKAAAEISHEMIGCLLGLPYFEFLKERLLQKKQA